MRQEKQLLIYCARTHLNTEKTDRIREILVQEVLDWNYILENGSFYNITPLLFHNLKGIADEHAIPEPVMDKLRQSHRFAGLRNMQIYGELRRILRMLKNERIPVMLLKGVALAKTIYPDIALRPMSDIDLLVKKTDLHAVAEVLTKAGYIALLDRPASFYEKHHHLMPYVKWNKSIMIEIHHNIAPEPLMSRIDADCLWHGTQIVDVAGINALTLSPENMVLHLCIHLSEDFYVERMKILVDVSEAIRCYGKNLNWHSIIGKSNKYKAGDRVYYSLYLAREIMDSVIPAYVLNSLERNFELKPFEEKILKIILKENILRNLNHFISSWIVVSLCNELFYTTGLYNRTRNILKIISRSAINRVIKSLPKFAME